MEFTKAGIYGIWRVDYDVGDKIRNMYTKAEKVITKIKVVGDRLVYFFHDGGRLLSDHIHHWYKPNRP